RPGVDPDNVQMSDILCDFCGAEWVESLAMVEGHRGSTICGRCLTAAYEALVVRGDDAVPRGYRCTMCLEERPDVAWRGTRPDAVACRRCVNQSAGVLSKDKESGWTRPDRPSTR